MKTASHSLVAGRLDGALFGVFSRGSHPVHPTPLETSEAHPHLRRLALGKALFTLARLAPAMLWLGNYGLNR